MSCCFLDFGQILNKENVFLDFANFTNGVAFAYCASHIKSGVCKLGPK